MDQEYITRAEHEEFRKRIEAEDHRQNRRIELLEESIEQQKTLTSSVEKLLSTWKACLMSRSSRANGWKSWKAGTARSGAVSQDTF